MQARANAPALRWMALALARLSLIIVLAATVGSLLNRVSVSFERSTAPAGFSRGVLQGILMPMSLPNLLAGRDVAIYSEKNSGVPYKLGYTLGVNLCGVVFFGLFFQRVRRWRSRGTVTR